MHSEMGKLGWSAMGSKILAQKRGVCGPGTLLLKDFQLVSYPTTKKMLFCLNLGILPRLQLIFSDS